MFVHILYALKANLVPRREVWSVGCVHVPLAVRFSVSPQNLYNLRDLNSFT